MRTVAHEWNEVSRREVETTLAGRTLTVTLVTSFTEDDSEIAGSFDFGDEAENEAYLARFESSEVVNVLVRVEASWHDSKRSDYLGGCHLLSQGLEAQVLEIARYHGMEAEALACLALEIQSKIKLYGDLK